LGWKELVPIFSFVFQKGSCRNCTSKISWQYPLVEIAAGALFVLIFLQFPPLSLMSGIVTIVHIFLACLLIVISAYDIKHKIIPDQFVWVFNFFAFSLLWIGGETWWHVPGWSMILAGPILALPFALLWLVSSGKWMGLGDAKLMLGLGWMIGINAGINAIILSFWIAAAISLIYLFVVYKRFKSRVEIPFGPYLVLGMYLVLLFNITVLDIESIKLLIAEYL